MKMRNAFKTLDHRSLKSERIENWKHGYKWYNATTGFTCNFFMTRELLNMSLLNSLHNWSHDCAIEISPASFEWLKRRGDDLNVWNAYQQILLSIIAFSRAKHFVNILEYREDFKNISWSVIPSLHPLPM